MQSAANSTGDMRIRPTRRIGIVLIVMYGMIYTGIAALFGVSYTEIGTTTASIVQGILVPVGVGGALLTGFTVWAGWWRPIWQRTAPGIPRVMWIIPTLLVGISLLRAFDVAWASLSAAYIGVLILGVLLIGYSEELLARGVQVLCARSAGMSEFGVLIYTSAVFGAMHAINAANGQSIGQTAIQVALTALIGAWLFVALRVSGVLIVPIVLHAVWDVMLLPPAPDPDALVRFGGAINIAVLICNLMLVGIVLWAWNQRSRFTSQ